jgi:hypothetical protein
MNETPRELAALLVSAANHAQVAVEEERYASAAKWSEAATCIAASLEVASTETAASIEKAKADEEL